jgi:hypothetical protein
MEILLFIENLISRIQSSALLKQMFRVVTAALEEFILCTGVM